MDPNVAFTPEIYYTIANTIMFEKWFGTRFLRLSLRLLFALYGWFTPVIYYMMSIANAMAIFLYVVNSITIAKMGAQLIMVIAVAIV